jgi:Alpha/beta hydrolase
VSRPTVTQAQVWRPEALRRLADAWDEAAEDLVERVDGAMRSVAGWAGASAEAAGQRAATLAADAEAAARSLVLAAVAARDGADQIEAAQADVLMRVSAARAEGFAVADDGAASLRDAPTPLLVALCGGDARVAREVLALRAAEVTLQIRAALGRLGAADADAAQDIDEAFDAPPADRTFPAGTVVAGWPTMSQDRIAAQVAAMTPDQRRRLVAEFPMQVGNTDGVPWDLRVSANRVNIAQAIVAEHDDGPEAERRLAFYRTLLGEIDDPTASGRRIDRQILAFDPVRASLVELNGNLATARNVAVLVPGLNTTMEGSAANTATARRFVSAGGGSVAMITYLGGPFPRGNLLAGVIDAANPRYALDMAPRLVAFSEDVDRTVDRSGRDVPVTYIGHSYGGSILGTAEAHGLTADRTLYVAAAGAGVGVDDPADWHNRNPAVVRYSMTPPGDLIAAVQGIPGGPHGADPDEMPGVIRLPTGDYDGGWPMAGPRAHSDVLNCPSDAWRNILRVITGDGQA